MGHLAGMLTVLLCSLVPYLAFFFTSLKWGHVPPLLCYPPSGVTGPSTQNPVLDPSRWKKGIYPFFDGERDPRKAELAEAHGVQDRLGAPPLVLSVVRFLPAAGGGPVSTLCPGFWLPVHPSGYRQPALMLQ